MSNITILQPNSSIYSPSLSVVIGRMQGLHIMHMSLMLEALKVSSHIVIVLGSAYLPRSPRNPYSVSERSAVILDSLSDEGIDVNRVVIIPVVDTNNDDALWMSTITQEVRSLGIPDDKITLVGHMKPDTQYLQEFGQWDYHEVSSSLSVSATIVRQYVRDGMWLSVKELVPAASYEFLSTHDHTYVHEFANSIDLAKYKLLDFPHRGHLNCPTADALVSYRGEILMIVRKNHPFKGMLALPGGHKQSNETFEQCSLRELKEETLIQLKEGTYKDSQMFDAPDRDPVCCKPTVAFTYEFQNSTPKVTASDDAERYEWIDKDTLESRRSEMAFDHLDIIRHFYPKRGIV